MNLSPHDFLEIGLRKARRDILNCIKSAQLNGLVIYLPVIQIWEGMQVETNKLLEDLLIPQIDSAIENIISQREREVDDVTEGYLAGRAHDEGVREAELKKKLAQQLGYDRFSDIPRKI